MEQKHCIVEKVTTQIVRHIAEREEFGWPPHCAALYYQPIRPAKGRRKRVISKSDNKK